MEKIIISDHARKRYAERVLESDEFSRNELDSLISADFEKAVQIDENTFSFNSTDFIVRNNTITTILR